MRDYVPINVNDLPDVFEIILAGENYTFRIDYNDNADYYTCTIQDADGNTLLTQEPLLMGQLVAIDIPDSRLPTVDLRILDETGQSDDAGKGELGTGNVQLYLDVVDPNGSETDNPDAEPLGYDPDESDDDKTIDEVGI